jgi:16S rRNA G966 N2-methylase RsmD
MTVKIEDYINKRNSTRNLSDEQFDNIIDSLALQLESYDYHTNYSESDLKKDWDKLCKWNTTDNSINSTSRIGMKLCEHFFPNFYDIENNKGESFANLWKKENLKKILRWNRKSHSTPYISELKRGIYFCCGLTKNTMYRPQMMRMACLKYEPNIVLDPCAGWGGRMLGAVSFGAHYIAFEPNTKTFNNLNAMAKFLGIESKVTLICDDALNMDKYDIPKVDMILTSPPYFDLEVYTHENTQSINNIDNYTDWSEKFLKQLIKLSTNKLSKNGISCWNVGKVGKNDMNDDVLNYHMEFGFKKIESLSVVSSKRQSNQTIKTKNAKSSDDTVVFKK